MITRLLTLVVLLFCGLLFIPGCGPEPIKQPPMVDKPTYIPIKEDDAEDLAEGLSTRLQGLDSWTELEAGLKQNLRYINARPQESVCVSQPGLVLTWGQLAQSVTELLGMLNELDGDPQLVAERFQWLKLAPGTLLTGYYEPWLQAALKPDDTFKYPLYEVPDDLKQVNLSKFHPRWKGQTLVYKQGKDGIEPYFDREAIDGSGALEGKGHEIAWAKDPIDVFFLQIQGSGRLDLTDGTYKHILYGGKNGHRYVSLGKILIERGHIPKEEMSMQRIRAFLNENPDVARELLFENPSYVFFNLADDGPYGSIGSILTPKVSVAVDRRMIPLGSVVVLKTALMNYETNESEQFMSIMLAQDTGGAIKGTRMDLFCGTGEQAESLAGHLQENSEVFMLVSKKVLEAATIQSQ